MAIPLTPGALPTGSITNSEVNSAAQLARSKFAINVQEKLTILPTDWRVHDAMHTVLPGTASSDDLALQTGTFATECPHLETSDAGNTSITQRARTVVRLPPEYVAAELVQLVVMAGMESVASTSATLDVEAYKIGDNGDVSGSDLYTGAAQSINSTTYADKTFTLTSTALNPGDMIDIRITVAATDSGGTGKIARLTKIRLASDNRG